MKKLSDRLWALQVKLSQRGVDSNAKEAMIREMREGISESILSKFDQVWARGRKPVALVRGGVCAECHIRVPRAQLFGLAAPDGGLQSCGSCGRFLYLPEEESTNLLVAQAKPKPEVRRKRVLAHAH